MTVLLALATLAAAAMTPEEATVAGVRGDVGALEAGRFEERDLPALARALGRTGRAEAVPRLALLLGLQAREVRLAAADALAVVPGAAGVARARLQVEEDGALRAALVAVLGAQGSGDDVAALAVTVGRAAPEGPAAAAALARLAGAGVDVREATPWLEEAVRSPLPGVGPAAVEALWRVGIAPSPSLAAWLKQRWSRLPGDAVKGAAVLALWPTLDDGAREALVAALCGGPWRTARARAAQHLPRAWAGRCVQAIPEGEPWIAWWSEAPEAPAAADPYTAEGTGAVVAARAALAAAPSEAVALLGAADAVVRELAADALAVEVDAALLVARLEGEAEPAVRLALLGALARAEAAGKLPEAVAGAVAAGLGEAPAVVARAAAPWAVDEGEPWPAGPLVAAAPRGKDLGARVEAAIADALAGRRRPLGAAVSTSRGVVFLDFAAGDVVAAAAFAGMAEAGAFDGLPWHRVVPGFVAQTGDPRGDGSGGSAVLLPAMPDARPLQAGDVAFAQARPGVAGSQWFVALDDAPELAGRYARVGAVRAGLAAVRALLPGDVVVRVEVTWAAAE